MAYIFTIQRDIAGNEGVRNEGKVLRKWGSGNMRYEEVRGWDLGIRRQEDDRVTKKWNSLISTLASLHFVNWFSCTLLGEALPLLLHGPVFFLFVRSYLHVLNFRHVEGMVVQEDSATSPYVRSCWQDLVREWGGEGVTEVARMDSEGHGTPWWINEEEL